MKIGILTHHYVNNYGSFLQAYSLQKVIEKEFPEHNVEIIDYCNIRHYIINTLGWYRFSFGKSTLSIWLRKTKVPGMFSRERKKYMKLSKRCYNAKQINRLGYDVIVVGSDEVWNFQDYKANASLKFGHGLIESKLISYAPSIANAQIEGSLPTYIAEGLKTFKAHSVRDDETRKFLKQVINYNAPIVLDPTFLADFPSGTRADASPYILFYYCDGMPKKKFKQIEEYAKKNNLKIYGAGQYDINFEPISKEITPFEWIELFRNAQYVFTGTFHGTVFSILNRRQYKVYLTNKSRVHKVEGLLKELGIDGRKITDDYVFDLQKEQNEIDYDAVYNTIYRKKKQSLEYLFNSIRTCYEE